MIATRRALAIDPATSESAQSSAKLARRHLFLFWTGGEKREIIIVVVTTEGCWVGLEKILGPVASLAPLLNVFPLAAWISRPISKARLLGRGDRIIVRLRYGYITL